MRGTGKLSSVGNMGMGSGLFDKTFLFVANGYLQYPASRMYDTVVF